MENKIQNRCEERVFKQWHFLRCKHQGKEQVEGKWYCNAHNPIKIAEKRKVKNAKWDAEWEERRQQMEYQSLAVQYCKKNNFTVEFLQKQLDILPKQEEVK